MRTKRWRTALLVGAVSAACGCAHLSPPPQMLSAPVDTASRPHTASASQSTHSVHITVTHLGTGRWQADYFFSEGADRLRFLREPSTFRRDRWEVVTPGLRLATVDDWEFIEGDGTRFDALTLRFASDPIKHEREYVLTPRFTDGSEAVYTGLLYVAALRDGHASPATTTVRLVPTAGESVVVGGRAHERAAEWTDPDGAGTYAYFGGIAPTTSEHVIGIVDPGLPDHLRAMLHDQLPELFDYFTRHLGYPLAKKPLILIGFSPTGGRGLSNSGDVLPNLIRLGFDGDGWAQDGVQARREAFHLLAHEAVHLWNNARFAPADGSREAWMHEGGADALAWLAMRDFGLLSERELLSELEGALNECAFISRGRPLGEIMSTSRVPYACGAVMNMIAASAVREHGGLARLWRTLFADAERSGGRYSSGQYFTALDQLSGDYQVSRVLQRLLTEPRSAEIPLSAPSSDLRRLGIRVDSSGHVHNDRARQLLRRVMMELMAADCGGRYSVSGEPDGFRVAGVPECFVLPAGVSRVTSFAGHSILDDAGGAYRAVARQCVADGRVSVTIAGQEADLHMACPRRFPPYVRVDRWPLEEPRTPTAPQRHHGSQANRASPATIPHQ